MNLRKDHYRSSRSRSSRSRAPLSGATTTPRSRLPSVQSLVSSSSSSCSSSVPTVVGAPAGRPAVPPCAGRGRAGTRRGRAPRRGTTQAPRGESRVKRSPTTPCAGERRYLAADALAGRVPAREGGDEVQRGTGARASGAAAGPASDLPRARAAAGPPAGRPPHPFVNESANRTRRRPASAVAGGALTKKCRLRVARAAGSERENYSTRWITRLVRR